METTDRTAAAPVALQELLAREPYRFDFYQALRLIECGCAGQPRIGQGQHAAEEPVRLGQEPSLAFAPSTVSAFEVGRDGLPPRLAVLFFGLFGPNGPLPLHLTEHARDRARNADDRTFSRFADLFHHRLLSLFYRAWANGQPAVNYDRPGTDRDRRGADRFALYVGSLFGLGMPSLRNRDAFPDRAKLHFASRYGAQTRPAEGLKAVLAAYFEVPVAIEEFVGEWLELPAQCRWRLGESPDTGSLGTSSTVGARVWDGQHKFRIVLGPLGYDDYVRMLPGSRSLARLNALVRGYVGHELSWDVNPVLKRQEVPPLVLGGKEKLGRTTWLTADRVEDAGDLVFDPAAGAN